jgi:hypothetical protein
VRGVDEMLPGGILPAQTGILLSSQNAIWAFAEFPASPFGLAEIQVQVPGKEGGSPGRGGQG